MKKAHTVEKMLDKGVDAWKLRDWKIHDPNSWPEEKQEMLEWLVLKGYVKEQR